MEKRKFKQQNVKEEINVRKEEGNQKNNVTKTVRVTINNKHSKVDVPPHNSLSKSNNKGLISKPGKNTITRASITGILIIGVSIILWLLLTNGKNTGDNKRKETMIANSKSLEKDKNSGVSEQSNSKSLEKDKNSGVSERSNSTDYSSHNGEIKELQTEIGNLNRRLDLIEDIGNKGTVSKNLETNLKNRKKGSSKLIPSQEPVSIWDVLFIYD